MMYEFMLTAGAFYGFGMMTLDTVNGLIWAYQKWIVRIPE